MSKIIILCDGTWNDETDQNQLTNVSKLRGILFDQMTQRGAYLATYRPNDDHAEEFNQRLGARPDYYIYYDTGVGTLGNTLSRLTDGATGVSLKDNLLQAYDYLTRVYLPGDEIYLFGFSRGAYTVRTLAGMINKCSLVRGDQHDISTLRDALLFYEDDSIPNDHPSLIAFKQQYTWPSKMDSWASSLPYPPLTIHFMGVFDTVRALGAPAGVPFANFWNRNLSFHDHELSDLVINAYHAVSIDEQRRHFPVVLWDVDKKHTRRHGYRRQTSLFPGVHSDVGGGYALGESGLSNNALLWMLGKAKSRGLGVLITPALKAEFSSHAGNTMIHDSWSYYGRFGFPFSSYVRSSEHGSTKDQRLHKSFFDLYKKEVFLKQRYPRRFRDSTPQYRPESLSREKISLLIKQNTDEFATASDSGSVSVDFPVNHSMAGPSHAMFAPSASSDSTSASESGSYSSSGSDSYSDSADDDSSSIYSAS